MKRLQRGTNLNSLTSFDFRAIGFVTPIGGLLLIMAWGVLLGSYLKKKA